MHIKFYYRPPCGLCREIEPALLRYAAEFGAQVTHVNIDEDKAAHARYWDKIPVIEIEDHVTLYEPITPPALRVAIQRAAH
ncbi:MAG: glutaredoxin family protein [Chloroflexi bacterium]|nr:glutaredoxin family protein [Chloroflexota bacterium]